MSQSECRVTQNIFKGECVHFKWRKLSHFHVYLPSEKKSNSEENLSDMTFDVTLGFSVGKIDLHDIGFNVSLLHLVSI